MRSGSMRGLAALVAAVVPLLAPAAAHAASLFGADASGARPGPTLLYRPAQPAPMLANTSPFRAAPLMVSGTDAYRDGEYVYQDYLFDDHGADTLPGAGSSLTSVSGPPLFSASAGDVLYPSGPRFLGNAADLVELRIRPTPRAIYYRVTLNTVTSATTAVVGIGIRTRPGSGGAPVSWPFGAGVSTPGLDAFLTVWGTGGALTRYPSGSTRSLARGAVHMDIARHQMTIAVPRSLIDPGGRTWRYVAGVGLWDGHGWSRVRPGGAQAAGYPVSGNPAVGAPAVFNLAFRFHEPQGMLPSASSPATTPGIGNWFEDGQARNLANRTTGDDYTDVDFGALTRRATRWLHPPARTQARIYASTLPTGQGVDHSGNFPEYRGRLQPYLISLPPGYDGHHPTPLTFALHPSLGGYTLFNVFLPNWGRELGDQRHSIVVANLARGINGPDPASGAYTGAAEADFFETWADVARRFDLDPRRTTLTGYSLGGYADYQMAEEWPDLFANVFSVVGAPASNGRNTELLANMRWVPILTWNQLDDSEVTYDGPLAASEQLTRLGYRHEAWTFGAGGHLGPALRDDWQPAVGYLGGDRVERDPSHIDYGLYPSLDDRGFGLVHDHAYWVSGLRLAAPHSPSSTFARGDVDVVSRAFGAGDPTPADYTTSGSAGGSPAVVQGVRWGAGAPVRPRNELDAALRNIGRIVVDGRRARLNATRPVAIVVSDDHAGTLRLDLHARALAQATALGPPSARIALRRSAALLSFARGATRFELSPTGRSCSAGMRATLELPRAASGRLVGLRVTVDGRHARLRRKGRRVFFRLRARHRLSARLSARTADGRALVMLRVYRPCDANSR